MSTVYLLGAGASRGYRGSMTGVVPPLAKDYFSTFAKLAISSDFEVKIGAIVNYVRDTRGISPESQPVDFDENVESVFAEVDRRLGAVFDQEGRKPEEIVGRFNLVKAYDQFVFWFTHVLNEIQSGRPCTIYRELVRSAGPQDTFITFNWDTILDRVLAESGHWFPDDGYGITFDGLLEGAWRAPTETRSGYKLLKLHGSTNWLGPYVTRHLQTGRRVWGATKETADRNWCLVDGRQWFATYKDRWRPGYCPYSYFFPPNDPKADLPLMPIIIPPKEAKDFDEYASVFLPIWRAARRELAKAEKLVILGYSFPSTDRHAFELLDPFSSRAGKTIEVVNPHPDEVRERVVGRVGSEAEVVARAQTLAAYLGLPEGKGIKVRPERERLFTRRGAVEVGDTTTEEGQRLAHLVRLLTMCNLHRVRFDLTTFDGRRYLDCILPGEFATHLYGAYRPEVLDYRLRTIPVEPKGAAPVRVAIEDIWIVFPLPEAPITDKEMRAVDVSMADPELVDMIRRAYHCVDEAELDWFLRRFLAA